MQKIAFTVFFSLLVICFSVAANSELFHEIEKRMTHLSVISPRLLNGLDKIVQNHTDSFGRANVTLRQALIQFEKKYASRMDESAMLYFQTVLAQVAVPTSYPILRPLDQMPLWLMEKGDLDYFRSSQQLPRRLDYLIIGAGLTGASAALELSEQALAGKSVALFESGPKPAWGASGRNGGNIEMMKENFLKDYRGFVEVQKDILRSRFPTLSETEVHFQAERQASYLLKFFQANVHEVTRIVNTHQIQADVSMKGWLRIAESVEEEKGLATEIAFAKKLGLEFEIWSPEKIFKERGIKTRFAGRFIRESGNYHPFKFVTEVLKVSIARGLQFYTETQVAKIEKQTDGTYLVHTNRGSVITSKIVMATNAETRNLFPEMTYIKPRVSHILNYAHVLNYFKGSTVTMHKGDWYANFPLAYQYLDTAGQPRGLLHVGGGKDTEITQEQVKNYPFLMEVYQHLLKVTGETLTDTKNVPPIRSWSGVMAFTGDFAPILSYYYRSGASQPERNIVFAVAFNGYGGSQSIIAGKVAAQMAVTGKVPEGIPDDLFSMRRFHTERPLFQTQSIGEKFSCRRVLVN